MGTWNNVRNYWAFFMERYHTRIPTFVITDTTLACARIMHMTSPLLCRMVGWLKNFIHSRPRPAPSLTKGYSIHMLARRAPTKIVQDYNNRWQQDGVDKSERGHLIYIQTLLARKKQQPGCGRVNVVLTQRNHVVVSPQHLPQEFLQRLQTFNAGVLPSEQFPITNPNIDFYEMQTGMIITL
jgi:hypothetical protein